VVVIPWAEGHSPHGAESFNVVAHGCKDWNDFLHSAANYK